MGSRVAIGVALTTGGVLTACAAHSFFLAISVAATTVVVAGFAAFAGRVAGRRIHRRGMLAAVGIGVTGGIAALLVAAGGAALVGAVWGLFDSFTVRQDYLWSYIGKPFAMVLAYGSCIAILLGALTGGLIYLWWLWRLKTH